MSFPIEPEELGALSHDAIAGTFRIWQRVHGHRYSIDDVLTAFVAAHTRPDAQRALELGSGIGSVLLMLCYKLPQTRFTAVEAQRNSFRLLSRNVAENGLAERVRLVQGDLRVLVGSEVCGEFELITGTPPYVPPGSATPSSDSQRAFARQELRGGVEAYIESAARVLAPTGRLVVCADARFPARVERSARSSGLHVLAACEAVPRAQRPALFTVFTLGFEANPGGPEHSTFCARDEHGARTEAYRDLRAFFGQRSASDEAPSP